MSPPELPKSQPPPLPDLNELQLRLDEEMRASQKEKWLSNKPNADELKRPPSKRLIPIENWMREKIKNRSTRYTTILAAIWVSIPLVAFATYFGDIDQWGHTQALKSSGINVAILVGELIVTVLIRGIIINRMLIADTRVHYWRSVCEKYESEDQPAVMVSPLFDILGLLYGYYNAARIILGTIFIGLLLYKVAFPIALLLTIVTIVTIGSIKFVFEWFEEITKESRWKEFKKAAVEAAYTIRR